MCVPHVSVCKLFKNAIRSLQTFQNAIGSLQTFEKSNRVPPRGRAPAAGVRAAGQQPWHRRGAPFRPGRRVEPGCRPGGRRRLDGLGPGGAPCPPLPLLLGAARGSLCSWARRPLPLGAAARGGLCSWGRLAAAGPCSWARGVVGVAVVGPLPEGGDGKERDKERRNGRRKKRHLTRGSHNELTVKQNGQLTDCLEVGPMCHKSV